MATRRARLLAATAIAGVMLLPASAAFGQTYGGGSNVPPEVQVSSSGVATPPAAAAQSGSSGGTLPFTGGDVASLTLIAGAAFGAGVVLTRSGRRRATA